MQSNGSLKIKGWIFDVYPANVGEMAVWIISENGQRIRLTDKFQPKIYVSGKKEDVEKLVGRIYSNENIANWCFVYKYANPIDAEKSRVLEMPKHYKQHVSQVIAAEQLIKEGSEIHAGNNVKFVFTHSEDKRHERRVKAAQLIGEGTNPDTKKYLSLLYASAANLLSFAGYTTQSVYETIAGQNQNNLLSYCKD